MPLWDLVAGVLSGSAGLVIRQLSAHNVLDTASMPCLARYSCPCCGTWEDLDLGAFYVTALTLLFQRPRWQRQLSVLASNQLGA